MSFRKKHGRALTLILSLALAVLVLPTAAFAIIADVDEGNDPGITITHNYNTKITLGAYDASKDSTIVEINELVESCGPSEDAFEGILTASLLPKLEAAAAKNAYTLVSDKNPSISVIFHYFSSPQVLNTDGDVIIVDNIDDLVNAYIEAGVVTSELTINEYSSVYIKCDATPVNSTVEEPTAVDTIKLTDVKSTFKPGDAPVFTAKSTEPDLYFVYIEKWEEVGGDKYLTSSDFFNRDPELLITRFEAGKQYKYSVWVKPTDLYDDADEWLGYASTLSTARTLIINNDTFVLTDDAVTDWEEAGIFFYPDFRISVGEKEDITTEPDTTAKPDVTPNPEPKPEPAEPDKAQTGDSSNIMMWIALLVLSTSGVAGIFVYGRKSHNA